MNNEQMNILLNKNGMKIVKLDTDNDNYRISFSIQNNNFILPSIINLDLVKLIFDLNPDICEKSILTKNIDETNATISSLMKDNYSDLGIPQYYISMNVEIVKISDRIRFICNQLDSELILPEYKYNNDLYLAPVKNMIFDFHILTNHHIQVNCDLKIDENLEFEQFIENIIISLINKIFNRIKQFIENLSFNNN